MLGPTCSREAISAKLDERDGNIEIAINHLIDPSPFRTQYPFQDMNLIPEPCTMESCPGHSSMASYPGPLSEYPSSVLSAKDKSTVDLKHILEEHNKNTVSHRVYNLEVNRNYLWRQACAFYKNAIHSPDHLHEKLYVEFVDEEGIDAGSVI